MAETPIRDAGAQKTRASWPGVVLFAFLALLFASGCASVRSIPVEEKPLAYVAEGRREAELAKKYAPIFLLHEAGAEYNKIGTPTAEKDGEREKVFVDPASPTIYFESREFATKSGEYINLIYRVHYPKTPGNLAPFMVTSGSNIGHLVVITLDRKTGAPLLVSQTHTCGCYLAMFATDYLPETMLPAGWKNAPTDYYGESLPALLAYKSAAEPRLLLEVRPGDHRVMGARIVDDKAGTPAPGGATWVEARLLPMESLKKLKLGEGTTSFYDESGFVKGSWKPWETFLMGWWAFDLRVGTDKEYGNPGNRFYTSLKVWAREDSDMNDFPKFLQYWGWGL